MAVDVDEYRKQFMSEAPPAEEAEEEPEQLELAESEEGEPEAEAETASEEEVEAAAEEAEEEAEEPEPEADEQSKAVAGLRNELVTLRHELRARMAQDDQVKASLEQMRQDLLKRSEATADPYEEEEKPAADPELLARLDRVQQHLDQQEQASRVDQTTRALQSDVESFKSEHPDYDEALTFAVDGLKRYYRRMGIPDGPMMDQNLNAATAVFIQRAMQDGKSPAAEAYELAKDWGWKPNGRPPAEQKKTKPAAEAKEKVKTLKKKAPASMSEMSGRGSKRQGVYTLEEFRNKIPEAERLKIIQDPDKWEQLMKTGEITL